MQKYQGSSPVSVWDYYKGAYLAQALAAKAAQEAAEAAAQQQYAYVEVPA